MVMPGGEAPGRREDFLRIGESLSAHQVDSPIVEQQEGTVKTADDEVLIVSRVTKDRLIGGQTRQILKQPAALDLQFDSVRGIVKLWAGDRAGPVDAVEVKGRRTAFRVFSGAVGVPRRELVSKVMSWSMNWPMKVAPAV